MSSKNTDVRARLLLDNRGLRPQLAASSKMFAGFAGNAAKALAVVGVGAVAGLVSLGRESEAMRSVLVKGTGATGEALKGLQADALAAMSVVPDAGAVVATALADVNTRLGLTGDGLVDTSELFLDFARLTDQDVSAAIKGVTDSLAVFGLEAGDSEETMGDLLRISQATGAPMDTLTGALQKQGGALSALGFNLEESASLLGSMAQEGVNLRKAGSGIEFFTDQMLAAGKDPREEWDLLTASIQGAKTDVEATAIAADALGPAGITMAQSIRSGALELSALAGEGVGVVAAQTAATQTLGQRISEIINKVQVGLMPVAAQMFVLLDKGLTALGPVMSTVAGGLSAFKSALTIGDGDVTSGGFAGFMEKFANFLLFGVKPILIDIREWIVTNWPAIRDTIVEGTTAIFEIIEEYWPIVRDTIVTVTTTIFDLIEEYWPAVRDTIVTVTTTIFDLIEEYWPAVRDIITEVMETVQALIERVTVIISAVWERWGEDILEFIIAIWGNIKATISETLDLIKNVFATFKALFSGDWEAMWDGIKAIADNVLELMRLAISRMWETIKLAAAVAWDLIKNEIGDVLKSLPGLVLDGVLLLAAAGKTLFTSAKNGMMDALGTAAVAVGGWLAGLPALVLAGVVAIAFAGKTLFTHAKNGIMEALATAAVAVGGWLLGLPALILSYGVDLYDAGLDMFTGLTDGLAAALAGVPAMIAEMVLGPLGAIYDSVLGVLGLGDGTGKTISTVPAGVEKIPDSVFLAGVTTTAAIAARNAVVLHDGGTVLQSMAQNAPGLARDEVLAVLQVGEEVTPAGATGTRGAFIENAHFYDSDTNTMTDLETFALYGAVA